MRHVAANATLQPNTKEFVPIAHHLHEPSLSVYANQEGLNAKSERSVSATVKLPVAPRAPLLAQRSVRELVRPLF